MTLIVPSLGRMGCFFNMVSKPGSPAKVPVPMAQATDNT